MAKITDQQGIGLVVKGHSVETEWFSDGQGVKISLDMKSETVQIYARTDGGFHVGSMVLPIEQFKELLFSDVGNGSVEPGSEVSMKMDQVKIWKLFPGNSPRHLRWYLYQHDTSLWSIREGFESQNVLTTAGTLEFEPGNSNRALDFEDVFRFKTSAEAIQALENWLKLIPDKTIPS